MLRRAGATLRLLAAILIISAGVSVSACGLPADGGEDVRVSDEDTGATETSQSDAGRTVDADAGADTDGTDETDGGSGGSADPPLPYADGVVEFAPGDGAGTGQQEMPDIVLGPPDGKGPNKGSLDVVSLGAEGEIVLEFGDRAIVDGEGADFIVFENPFYYGDSVYKELGEVSVSVDGETWKTFDCDTDPAESGRWPGCAGWRPVEDYDPEAVVPLEPAITGGDPFDLADLGMEKARYVRIKDVSQKGSAPSTGFDLDAVGVVHGVVE